VNRAIVGYEAVEDVPAAGWGQQAWGFVSCWRWWDSRHGPGQLAWSLDAKQGQLVGQQAEAQGEAGKKGRCMAMCKGVGSSWGKEYHHRLHN